MKIFNANYDFEQKQIGRVWLNGVDVTNKAVTAYMSEIPYSTVIGWIEVFVAANEPTQFEYGDILWERS